jgi:hypothetical protein
MKAIFTPFKKSFSSFIFVFVFAIDVSLCAIVEPYHLISSIVRFISKIHYLIIVTLISFIA